MNNTRTLLGCQGEKMQTLEHFSLVYVFDEHEEDDFWTTLEHFSGVQVYMSYCQDEKMQTLEHFSLVYVSDEHEEDDF